jgi:hypothetical protein
MYHPRILEFSKTHSENHKPRAVVIPSCHLHGRNVEGKNWYVGWWLKLELLKYEAGFHIE